MTMLMHASVASAVFAVHSQLVTQQHQASGCCCLASQAVVAADVELMQLRAEEAELTRRLGDLNLGAGGAAAPADGAALFHLPASLESNLICSCCSC